MKYPPSKLSDNDLPGEWRVFEYKESRDSETGAIIPTDDKSNTHKVLCKFRTDTHQITVSSPGGDGLGFAVRTYERMNENVDWQGEWDTFESDDITNPEEQIETEKEAFRHAFYLMEEFSSRNKD